MKSYLNAKLIFVRNFIKKSTIISDKKDRTISAPKKIAKKRNLKLLDVSTEIEKSKNISSNFRSDF